jgi:hypothetical protein
MDYTGICAACFEPIRDEDLFQFRESGRKFHKNCAKKERNFYVRLEKKLARKEGAEC